MCGRTEALGRASGPGPTGRPPPRAGGRGGGGASRALRQVLTARPVSMEAVWGGGGGHGRARNTGSRVPAPLLDPRQGRGLGSHSGGCLGASQDRPLPPPPPTRHGPLGPPCRGLGPACWGLSETGTGASGPSGRRGGPMAQRLGVSTGPGGRPGSPPCPAAARPEETLRSWAGAAGASPGAGSGGWVRAHCPELGCAGQGVGTASRGP